MCRSRLPTCTRHAHLTMRHTHTLTWQLCGLSHGGGTILCGGQGHWQVICRTHSHARPTRTLVWNTRSRGTSTPMATLNHMPCSCVTCTHTPQTSRGVCDTLVPHTLASCARLHTHKPHIYTSRTPHKHSPRSPHTLGAQVARLPVMHASHIVATSQTCTCANTSVYHRLSWP